MREFTFAIEYDQEADPIMDVFIDYPSLVARSLDGFVTEERFWRIEWIAGPEPALDRIEDIRFDETTCSEAITEKRCETAQYHDSLSRSTGKLILYTYLADIRGGESVHTLAGKHFPAGALFKTNRRKSTHWWKILLRSDEKIGAFYDDMGAQLREGLSFRMGHLRDASGWFQDSLSTVTLPKEQESALRAAVSAGYYQSPRKTTLDEIAAELNVPRSTLSYRLRQAESKLVHRYVGGDMDARFL